MIAVLLIGFGGPECLEEVGPFIEGITGRELPPERLAASVEKYRIIGGGSPLCGISRRQGAKLETALRQAGVEAKVYLGMRYWNPSIAEAAAAAVADKPDRFIVMCLTPYYSRMSSGDYLTAARDALTAAQAGAPVDEIKQWNTEPGLIEAFAAGVKDVLGQAGAGARVMFTAHSLPQSMIDGGDLYADQVGRTVELTAAAAGLDDWLFGWQSAGHGYGEWLKPDVEETLEEAKAGGAKGVAVVPIGFISDHVETLYDLDIVLKRQARDRGLEYSRATGLNDIDLLAGAMAAAVIKKLKDGGSEA
jgi:protoporphyrin/coproporphyrin ferrochelatase